MTELTDPFEAARQFDRDLWQPLTPPPNPGIVVLLYCPEGHENDGEDSAPWIKGYHDGQKYVRVDKHFLMPQISHWRPCSGHPDDIRLCGLKL